MDNNFILCLVFKICDLIVIIPGYSSLKLFCFGLYKVPIPLRLKIWVTDNRKMYPFIYDLNISIVRSPLSSECQPEDVSTEATAKEAVANNPRH